MESTKKSTPERLSIWQRLIILMALPLWVIQIILAGIIVASPGRNNTWHLSTKWDFNHYYRTSERVTSSSPYVYCVPFSEDRIIPNGLHTHDIREPTNPPLLSVFLSPIAYTTHARAWAIYILLSLFITLGSMWFCVRRWQGDAPRHLQRTLMVVVTLSPPLLALMIYSQVQGFILALCLLTLALSARYPTLSGITLGIAIALKAYAAPLLAFLFLTRRYRIFTAALLTAILGALLPGYFDPRLSFPGFLQCGLAHVNEWTLGTSNQNIVAILKAMLEGSLSFHGLFERERVSPMYQTAATLLWLGSGVVLGALFRSRRAFEEGFLAALALCVMFAPVVWSHYYIFVWPYLIRIWREIPFGSKIILWLSFPLMPWYVAEGSHSLTTVFTHPPGALLPWLPGSICITQFLVILFNQTIRPASTHQGQNKSAATV